MQLRWSEKYSVGNKMIDIQHKMLFSIINELSGYITSGDGLNKIEEVLEKMSVYARMHFRTEEDLLFKANYDELVKHKVYHESFKREILHATQNVISNKHMDTVVEVHKFLQSWLTCHILDEDVKYCEHLD
ncbi:MAG: hemerythrin family protein [Clostridiales bacterium]|nr:hemerythrin family protein [Clostridiales bacterium]